jgi:hypothetical protein
VLLVVVGNVVELVDVLLVVVGIVVELVVEEVVVVPVAHSLQLAKLFIIVENVPPIAEGTIVQHALVS